MTLAQDLGDFNAAVAQCDNLIANSHQKNQGNAYILPELDRQQITMAAFLNLFIAWEAFLESAIAKYLVGHSTINGGQPVKYASPPTVEKAMSMLKSTQKYFDYSNHEYVKKIVNLYFDSGSPIEPHISAIASDLSDIRTMRNAAAHKTTTTQTALESLAIRIFGQPRTGILLYDLLMSPDPGPAGGTVYTTYRDKIAVAANLIAHG